MIPKLRMWASDSGTTRIEMTKCQDTLRVITLKTWKGLEGHKIEPPRFANRETSGWPEESSESTGTAIDELRMTRTSPVDVKMTGTEKEWQQWVGNSGDSGDSGHSGRDRLTITSAATCYMQSKHVETCRNMSKHVETCRNAWTCLNNMNNLEHGLPGLRDEMAAGQDVEKREEHQQHIVTILNVVY